MKIATRVAIAATGLMFMGGAADADTVTFDNVDLTGVVDQPFEPGEFFTIQGLTFTNNADSGTMYIFDGTSPNSNGTNNNIFCCSYKDYETITKAGGGSFDLYKIDLAISWYDPYPTDVITINGSPLTITTTLTTYDLNLLHVTSVNISGVHSDTGYWLADNIVIGVPEPSTWAMIVLGFAGLGLAGYRRARAGRAPRAA